MHMSEVKDRSEGMYAERHRRAAFTLIELLVVVAIIALLIAILLPSLNTARRQARTTLCATRIGQLTRSLVLYAEDFEETPPFVGTGYGNIATISGTGGDDYFGESNLYWAERETWIVPRMPECWLVEESVWPEESILRNGSLFPYARFEALYRCPEFERVSDSRRSQNVFNYTRSILGRKALSMMWSGDGTQDDIAPGPIIRMSAPRSPAALWMLLDEQWDYNCAAPADDLGNGGGLLGASIWSFWQGAESIHCICGDMLGSYHGSLGKELNFQAVEASRKGNVSCYDGHVELLRDPLPYRTADIGAPDFTDFAMPAGIELFDMLSQLLYAQRGLTTSMEEILDVFM